MMNRISVVALFLLSLIMAACEQPQVSETLILKETISLVVRGEDMFEYDGNKCQMAYNAQRCEYRVMDDDMAHYFILKFEADLTDVGQEVTADIRYTTINDVKNEEGLTFKVERTDPSSGMFWLWCQSKKIGAVVRKL